MFDTHYGLTAAAKCGTKTATRCVINEFLDIPDGKHEFLVSYCQNGKLTVELMENDNDTVFAKSRFSIGEIVALAESYSSTYRKYKNEAKIVCRKEEMLRKEHIAEMFKREHILEKGWDNKLFVRPEEMLYTLTITDIEFHRLQDIDDNDCLKEGIYQCEDGRFVYHNSRESYETPKEAFASLIDVVTKKGTWKRNPYCFVYYFTCKKNDFSYPYGTKNLRNEQTFPPIQFLQKI